MAFWGIEIKPGKPFTHDSNNQQRRLHVSQATLGYGTLNKRSVVQCNVGNKSPILLCALLPEKTESCQLNLEFEEEDEVIFSVLGPRSVHLTGYYLGSGGGKQDDDSESYGEDIADTESEKSSDYGTKEEGEFDDFIDDGDLEMFPPSENRTSAVVIEGINDNVKPANWSGKRKRLKKKYEMSDSEGEDDKKQNGVKDHTGDIVLDSEDEDGYLISSLIKKNNTIENIEAHSEKKLSTESKIEVDSNDLITCKERKSDSNDRDSKAEKLSEILKDSSPSSFGIGQDTEAKPKKKKKKHHQVQDEYAETDNKDTTHTGPVEVKLKEEQLGDRIVDNAENVNDQDNGEMKKNKKKKKKKSKAQEGDENGGSLGCN